MSDFFKLARGTSINYLTLLADRINPISTGGGGFHPPLYFYSQFMQFCPNPSETFGLLDFIFDT